jgi:ubiquinone/menaquinone biosynthesis C-methylase UbiE
MTATTNEANNDYEYKGLIAQAWDVLRGDTSGWPDRPFYLDLISRYGQPVLDVGCGTGRLLLDYLAQGLDIDGVDNSPDMLALCREKAQRQGLAPRLYQQWAEALDLPRHYRTILVPSSTLQLIIEPEQAVQALQRLRAHLLPGGAVAASIMALGKASDPLEIEWERTATRAEDGAVFRRVARSRYDPATQLEHTEDLYQLLRDDQIVAEELHRRSPATRSYTAAEAQAAFEAAGFEVVKLYSGFTFEPLKPADEMFVVVGEQSK